ncbi:MAG: GntR family transcriptional regulator [Pseudorhodobacter sp.]|nr:GntR family transcriptional regulator [Pseudorhodobacter sp.]
MTSRVGLAKSERVALTLEREIREGRVLHGDQLQSEGNLMQRFADSRNTVRRGLDILSRQGLITTRTGIGSFVTHDGATIDSNLGWTVALASGNGPVETRALDIRRSPCAKSADFLAEMGLEGVNDFLCIDRLRYCTQQRVGISLERSRLPWRDDFAPILESGLVGGSLSRTLQKVGLAAASGEEIAGVVPALTAIDATIMARKSGEAVLRLQRITRAEDGSVLEYVDSLLDPLRFGLRMSF